MDLEQIYTILMKYSDTLTSCVGYRRKVDSNLIFYLIIRVTLLNLLLSINPFSFIRFIIVVSSAHRLYAILLMTIIYTQIYIVVFETSCAIIFYWSVPRYCYQTANNNTYNVSKIRNLYVRNL